MAPNMYLFFYLTKDIGPLLQLHSGRPMATYPHSRHCDNVPQEYQALSTPRRDDGRGRDGWSLLGAIFGRVKGFVFFGGRWGGAGGVVEAGLEKGGNEGFWRG
jgi:hypothetical protein